MGQYFRGVNLSQAEFGQNHLPGVYGQDYTYGSEDTYRYFGGKGLNVFRLCMRWERLQHQLRGPLDPDELGYIRQSIAWAKAHGVRIMIEPHNYGRYGTVPAGDYNNQGYIIDGVYNGTIPVSRDDFADFWVKVSNEFKDEPAVWAYDLMNEPHDMRTASWKQISQTVVDAIRQNGDTKLILVPGDSWSSANRWQQTHGPTAWITDPANNFMYEAHQYFDQDESGGYAIPQGFTGTSYDRQLALQGSALADIGSTRVQRFINWLNANNVRGFLGEYGIPDDDPRWKDVLGRFLGTLDQAGMGGAYWAAGEWWGNYGLSVQPASNFTVDRPQMPTLLAHSGAALLDSVSAASGALKVAPDSLVSGYGRGLASDVEVRITDRGGFNLTAPLFYAGPTQVNYLLPAGAPVGTLDIWVYREGKAIAGGALMVELVAPSVFSANANGQGIAAAQVLRIKPDGTRTIEEVARYDEAQKRFIALPLDFGGDRLFVQLYGTGMRHATGAPTLQIGTVTVPVMYLGAQGQYEGLDQINAELPRALSGAGEVPVGLTVDGKPANTVTLSFR